MRTAKLEKSDYSKLRMRIAYRRRCRLKPRGHPVGKRRGLKSPKNSLFAEFDASRCAAPSRPRPCRYWEKIKAASEPSADSDYLPGKRQLFFSIETPSK
ncbi:hypothetical protein NEILACOT_04805 [Neisseria lactamica ATCC 23970]|uniref:Uncharacterized protein n=1 Tax=Neisseria lactamica ATCC 23970 TaxID=546265 RepID=D0WB80_NEILA|nr:hypothetical protein NEILACOT_04805 [Neisseria lactamica ATCC 23970]